MVVHCLETALSVRDLSVEYNGIRVVSGFSCDINRGEIVGLFGPNGAGKSTVLDGVSGIVKSVSGRIALTGETITGLRPHEIAARGVGRLFQRPRVIERLSVGEHLLMAGTARECEGLFAALRGVWSRGVEGVRVMARAGRTIQALGLRVDLEAPAAWLSFGQRKLLNLAMLIERQPRMLLLDEPIAGLAPEATEAVISELRLLRKSGTGIIIVEHNVEVLASVCDRIGVMNAGRLIQVGEPTVVFSSKQVSSAESPGK